MRVVLSIPISFLIYVILARGIAGPLAGLYPGQSEDLGLVLAFILLFIFTFIAGFTGGWMCRERIGPLFGGIITTIYILSINDHTIIAKAIFYAAYATLSSDKVLLGLAIILFNFLWGGKLGEQYGFRKDRNRLLPDDV